MPDGTARNNIQSPEVARAVAYQVELLQSKTMVPSNARQSFGEGSVAMCIGHRWFAYGYAKLIKTDDLGVVPLPRDPDADQYYAEEDGGGYFIPKYAPNPEGALAAANAMTYYMRSEDYKRLGIEERLEQALQKLPERCRSIFVMNKLEGKKQQQIASELQISINTVESQMAIAYKKLREELKDCLPLLLFLFTLP